MMWSREEYTRLLDAELAARNYNPLSSREIVAFIGMHRIWKYKNTTDVQSDMNRLIQLHSQAKTGRASTSIDWMAPTKRESNKPAAPATTRTVSTPGTAGNKHVAPAAARTGSAPGTAGNKHVAPAGTASNKPIVLSKGQVAGLSGKVYTLENKAFSSGGEGDIFGLVGDKKQVVKIYHPDRVSVELEKKLQFMAKNPPASSILDQVAWPMDVVYDGSRQFKGFVMPRLDINAELGDVYGYPPSKPESKIAYNYKLILAMNICTVIDAVHSAGYIFGDFNPRNIGINMQTGRVAFLDTDSYHIVIDEKANKAYRCKVCLDGYVAPELLKHCEPYKKDAYENTPLPTFTKETDNFALAIHIFRLLMNGYTPFNGIKAKETASTASPGIGNQAIKRDSYCFKKGNKPQAAAVPPKEILPVKIQESFDRAFITGRNDPKKRPTAKEWHTALLDYEKALVPCAKNKAHMYKKGLSKCPWCEADESYRRSLAPPLTQRTFPTPPTAPAAQPAVPPPAYAPITSGLPGTVVPPPTQTFTRAPVSPPAGQTMQSTPPAAMRKAALPRKEIISKAASVLYPIGWIVFLANALFCLSPFIKNGSFVYSDSMLYGLNYRQYTVSSLVSVALLCFAAGLRDGSNLATVFSGIWSFIVCFGAATVRYTQMGFSASNTSNTWKYFGILLTVFAAVLLGSIKLGAAVRKGPSAGRLPTRPKFRARDVFSLVILIGITAVGIFLLLNLDQLYNLARSYNLFGIGIWAIAIVCFFVFGTMMGNNAIVDAWFFAAMAVLFECALLTLALCELIWGFILWCVLGLAAIGFSVAIGEADHIVAYVTIPSFLVFFIAGTIMLMSLAEGPGNLSSVGEGLRWWTTAPVVIDAVVAAGFSVAEIAKK